MSVDVSVDVDELLWELDRRFYGTGVDIISMERFYYATLAMIRFEFTFRDKTRKGVLNSFDVEFSSIELRHMNVPLYRVLLDRAASHLHEYQRMRTVPVRPEPAPRTFRVDPPVPEPVTLTGKAEKLLKGSSFGSVRHRVRDIPVEKTLYVEVHECGPEALGHVRTLLHPILPAGYRLQVEPAGAARRIYLNARHIVHEMARRKIEGSKSGWDPEAD